VLDALRSKMLTASIQHHGGLVLAEGANHWERLVADPPLREEKEAQHQRYRRERQEQKESEGNQLGQHEAILRGEAGGDQMHRRLRLAYILIQVSE
jgi:hypothetical protein